MSRRFKGMVAGKLAVARPRHRGIRLATALEKSEKFPRTITVKQLAAQIAEKHGVDQAQSELVLAGLVDIVTTLLRQGHQVHLDSPGILAPRQGVCLERDRGTGGATKLNVGNRLEFGRPGSRHWP